MPTTTNRRKNRIAQTIAQMPLIPSQSVTRRSPGLPASARRFSVWSLNDGLVTRDTLPDSRAGERAQGPLDERLLELELLEVLRLHRPELGQAGLDRIDRRAADQPDDDQQDGGGRDAGDQDGQDRHR